MTKGREEGIEKGMQKAKTTIAITMLGKGMDVATISEVMGLTEEEINKMAE